LGKKIFLEILRPFVTVRGEFLNFAVKKVYILAPNSQKIRGIEIATLLIIK
jgi:hypothetical protein